MNTKTIRDALASHKLVVVLGEGTASLAIDLRYAGHDRGRFEVLAWPASNGVAQERKRARDAVGFAHGRMGRAVVFAPVGAFFLSELSACAMLHGLPALAKAHGYDHTIAWTDVAVFVVEGLHLVPVEGSRHGWRIESEDAEIERMSALMQDCFHGLDAETSDERRERDLEMAAEAK